MSGKVNYNGEQITLAWARYERGRAYNSRLTPNQYELVNTNIDFFAGEQWKNLPDTPAMRRLPKPVFNIVKRVVSLFVASLTSSAASVSFDELSYYGTPDAIGTGANGADANGPGANGAGANGADANGADANGADANGPGEGRVLSGESVSTTSGPVAPVLGAKGAPAHPGGLPAPPVGETLSPATRPSSLGTSAPSGGKDVPPAARPGSERRPASAGDVARGGFISPEHQNGGGHSSEAEMATAEVQNLLEKFKMEYRIREALFDGAQTGDYCAHFWWDPQAKPYGGAFGQYLGEIQMELVDGINVMFGNPNTPDVERQPYILIVGRDTVANLADELKRRGGGDAGEVMPDAETWGMAGQGGRTELDMDGEDGKALYVYMYEKKKGRDGKVTVHVSKATRGCAIFEDVDTGLSRYPIAWGNWEKQKNQYHGRALVTGIIPNQIFINKMFAMVMKHMELMAFPKVVYDAERIGHWNSEVGQAIAVRNVQPGDDMRRFAYQLQPAEMSRQIMETIDKAVAYTKDCLGATDAQLGNVKPDNTSALMVLQQSAEVPLENTRACLYEWLEDVGAILLDMMGTYYGTRPMVRDRTFDEPVTGPATGMPEIDPVTGMIATAKVTRRVAEIFDFSRFKTLWFNVRVNAGASTYFSEIAMVQTLDNLRRDGTLDVIEYLERVPDKLIPRKGELVQKLKEQAARPQQTPQGSGGQLVTPLSEDKAVAMLPAGMQAKYAGLPGSAQRSLRQVGAMKGQV